MLVSLRRGGIYVGGPKYGKQGKRETLLPYANSSIVLVGLLAILRAITAAPET